MEQFLINFVEAPQGVSIALLPSPYVVIARQGKEVVLYAPHQRIWQIDRAEELLFCMPHLLKVLFGHPRYYINKSFTVKEMPLLEPFRTAPGNEWRDLLDDARASVPVLMDEAQFLREWPLVVTDGHVASTEAQQRQLERICKRYAGQSPSQILQEIRLSDQLAVDIGHKIHVPGSLYADQSHYIRESRKLTGHTPAYWQNLSATFYTHDGQLVMIEA